MVASIQVDLSKTTWEEEQKKDHFISRLQSWIENEVPEFSQLLTEDERTKTMWYQKERPAIKERHTASGRFKWKTADIGTTYFKRGFSTQSTYRNDRLSFGRDTHTLSRTTKSILAGRFQRHGKILP